MGVVVDTSLLIAFERAALLAGADETYLNLLPEDAVISAVTAMELRIGALLGSPEAHRTRRLVFLTRVLGKCPLLPFAALEAEEAARLFVALRRAGNRIGERDLLIAATAIANGHALITLNRAEFERVPGLALLDPPDLGQR